MRVLVSFVLAWAVSATAIATDCLPAFAKVFQEAYGIRACDYKPHLCSVHVLTVAQELEALGVNLDSARVIVLVKERQVRMGVPMDVRLEPHNPISGAELWLHHVVLELDGKIFDLQAGPQGLLKKDYMDRLFPALPRQARERSERIFVRDLDLEDYRLLMSEDRRAESIKLLTSRTDTQDFPHTLRPYASLYE